MVYIDGCIYMKIPQVELSGWSTQSTSPNKAKVHSRMIRSLEKKKRNKKKEEKKPENHRKHVLEDLIGMVYAQNKLVHSVISSF